MSDKATGNSVRTWTPPQLAAISHRQGNLLVSAAAGSGKTAVLAERCARLVSEGEGSAPRTGMENLLVLTFTEAAATEMRSRIAAALHEKLRAAAPADQRWLRRQAALVDRADISTLHAFCMRILRQHFHQAQLDPAFDIVDQEESQLLQEEVLDDLAARWLSLPSLPPTPGGAADDPLSAAAFGTFYEAYAQGSPGLCRQMILTLHRMLVSTAYPDRYQAAARGLYGSGAAATMAAFNQEVLQSGLRLARLATQRACDEMSRHAGAGQMGAALGLALTGLDDATAALAQAGVGGADDAGTWARVGEHLAIPWPKLIKTVKEIEDFEGLKKRHYQAIKERIAKLAEVFARDPAAMRRDLVDLAGPLETLLEMTRQFGAAFTAAKRADNRLDFADLERLAFNLLMAPGSLARADLCQRYHFVLVDEFQDINPLQAELLAAVSHPGAGRGNLFVVGDIKQSIYAFRLAQPDLFHRREQAARAAQQANPEAPREYLSLSHNFRSHPELLAAMNRIFERILTPEVARIDYTQGHELQPPPTPDASAASAIPERAFAGIPVEMHLVSMEAVDEEDAESPDDAAGGADAGEPDTERLNAVEQEAQVVAERIAALLQENRSVREKGGMVPLRPRHIAILLRTMKNKAMIFARALASRGIPVHADLSAGFFETPEVKDTLALLQVLDNPQQDIPLATVLLGPFGQFSHDDLARIRLAFDRKEVPFARAALDYPRLGAAEGAPAGALKVEALPELAARLRELYARLERWRELLRARPLHEGLAEIFAQSRIFAYVAGLDTGAQRVANLQYLHQRALAFSTFKKQGLHRFLRFIERLRERETAGFGGGGGDIGEAPVLSEASDVVRILSVHKSKGLEFPVVFVSGLGGKLQLTPAGPVLLHPDLGVGLYVADAERNVAYPSAAALRIAEDQRRALRAEELRLLYVAMTRARECLILSGHVGKAADIEKWRRAWGGYRGPLPEDVLLQGRRALDWLMPALATGGDVGAGAGDGQRLAICWDPQGPGAAGAQVVVHVHGARRQAAESRAEGADGAEGEMLARVIAGEPLAEVPADARVGPMIQRVTGRYRFAEQVRQAAVQTVTFLKTGEGQREAAGEVAAAVPVDLGEEAAMAEMGEVTAEEVARYEAEADGGAEERAVAGEAARLRGIATHRVLELLDLARCDSVEAVEGQVGRLVEGKALTEAEVARANWEGIHWFLWQSAVGLRVVEAARRAAGGGVQVRREIPFVWVAGGSGEPADMPTVRGVIDLLVADAVGRRAEIVDYKTDAVRLWEGRVEDYRRQMGYYLAAASEILGYPVGRATLVFLAARREVEVRG